MGDLIKYSIIFLVIHGIQLFGEWIRNFFHEKLFLIIFQLFFGWILSVLILHHVFFSHFDNYMYVLLSPSRVHLPLWDVPN